MNSYITLGGKQYTTSTRWEPAVEKSMRYQLALNGSIVATYAAAEILTYDGEIRVNATESRAGWGSPTDLESTLGQRGAITFIDHDGASHSVHVKGWKRASLIPRWDSPSNKFFYDVTLVGTREASA